MLIQSAMSVEIYWHIEDSEFCQPLAEAIYKELNRDPSDNSRIGLEIPVYFFTNPEMPQHKSQSIRTLRLFLLTPKMRLEKKWTNLIDDFGNDTTDLCNLNIVVTFEQGIKYGNQLNHLILKTEESLNLKLSDFVIAQCCRLLSDRAHPIKYNLGVAPLKLFISHTKRDSTGEHLAIKLMDLLQSKKIETFFDKHIIQPGDQIGLTLEQNILDAILLVVRTDRYSASPWCRKEIAIAKENDRPIIVVDALENFDERSSSLLNYLPVVRLSTKAPTISELSEVTKFLGREVLRFLFGNLRLKLLEEQDVLPKKTEILVRPPDINDIPTLNSNSSKLAFPDPVLSVEESSWASKWNTRLITPLSIWNSELTKINIGLSVGNADESELLPLGLSNLHITDASRVIARTLLVAGAKIVYGGALELQKPPKHGENLVTTLIEMIATNNDTNSLKFPPLINYAAWPFWKNKDETWLAINADYLEIVEVDAPEGAEQFSDQNLGEIFNSNSGRILTGKSLSKMREKIVEKSVARIVLGGKIKDYAGFLPGIVEESYLTIEKQSPLYVLGGFGGAGAAVVEALKGNDPTELDLNWQVEQSENYAELVEEVQKDSKSLIDYPNLLSKFKKCGLKGISDLNGLSENENMCLCETNNLDEAMTLIMRGMCKKFRDQR